MSQPHGPLQTSGTYDFAPSMGSMVMYAFTLAVGVKYERDV